MKRALAVFFLIFVCNITLNDKVFQPGESPNRRSIELNYAGMARFVKLHPNFWGWKPLQYAGLPTAYQYVPAAPYGVAAISAVSGFPHERVHRMVTAAATSAIPASSFLLMWYFTRSFGWALIAAIAMTFFSPLYGLFPHIDQDRSPSFIPWRWQLLMKYGEGPHNVGLALMPLAIVAVARYAQRGLKTSLAVASILLAAIPLVNWVAALAMAIVMICFLLATLGLPDKRIWRRRVLFASLLAYLLAAFALTPAFIRTVAFNWPVDSPNFQAAQEQRWALAGLIAVTVLMRSLLLWQRASFFLAFVTLAALVFGFVLVQFGFRGVDVFPEAHRYAPEFELFLVLALAAWARAGWNTGLLSLRIYTLLVAAIMLAEGAYQPLQYLTSNWSWFHPINRERTEEYVLAKWLNEHITTGRALLTGGLRFRMASWFDVPQVGGGFESGLKNRVPVEWSSSIRHSLDDIDLSIARMQTLGVEYVVVHGPQSREFYKDYKNPAKFEGRLERVFTYGDNAIYRVPFVSLAEGDFCWQGPSYAEIRNFPSDRTILIRVSHDPGWRALQGGAALRIDRDVSGMMRVTPRSASKIELIFGPTHEQISLAGVSAGAWLYVGFLILRRRRKRIKPAVKAVAARPA